MAGTAWFLVAVALNMEDCSDGRDLHEQSITECVCMSSPSGWPSHQNNNNTLKTNEEDNKSQAENDVITTTTTAASDMSRNCTPVAASTCSVSQNSCAAVEPTIVEEYLVSIPLVRPKPAFLKLLHKIGAHGEIFTMKELCFFLKEYIKAKLLYDLNDPSIVYCQNDELGDVFQVNTFTINDVIALLTKHCTYVPDTCLKRKRRILSPASQHAHQQRLYAAQNNEVRVSVWSPIIPVNSPVSTSSKNSPAPVISSTSPPEWSVSGYRSGTTPESTLSSMITQAVRTNPVSSPGLATDPVYTAASRTAVSTQALTTVAVSVHRSNAPPVTTVASGVSQGSGSFTASTEQGFNIAHVQDNELLRLSPEGTQPQCSRNGSSEVKGHNTMESCSQIPTTRKTTDRLTVSRARKHLRNKSSSESSDAVSSQSKRPRHTSISDGAAAPGAEEYPWYFRGNREASDESEALSIQSKETAIGRKDSSDDLWFLQEEQGPSDTFSVEYEVQSEDDSPGIRASFGDSDASNTSQEDLVVICHDSDMDFWADADSSTDSDSELTVADNWTCDECDNVNPPLQRYCSRCWKLRSSWLPDKNQATIRHKNNVFTAATSPGERPKKPSSSVSSLPSSAPTSQPKFASSPKSRKSSSSRRTHFSHRAPSISLSQDRAAESQPLSSMEEKENTNILSYDSALQYDSGLGTLSSSQGSQGSRLSQRSSSHHNISASSPITPPSATCFISSSANNNAPVPKDSSNTIPVTSCLTDKKHSSRHKLNSNMLESRTTLSNFQVNIGPVLGGYDEVDGDMGKTDDEPRNDENEAGPSGVRATAPLTGSHSSDQFKVLCMICLSNPKNACLIHGNTSHQVCCYSCAKILKKRGKVCPVCRRPIWHVTKNYMV